MLNWLRKPDRTADKFDQYTEIHRSFMQAATQTVDITRDVAEILKAKLEASTRHIRATSAILSDTLLLLNEHGVVLNANEASVQMFGMDLTNSPLTAIEHNEFSLSFPVLLEILTANNAFSYNHSVRGSDVGLYGVRHGHPFSIEISGSSFPDHRGRTVYLLLIRDITEEEIMQQRLVKSEEHYRAIFQNGFDPIAVMYDFEIIDSNRAFDVMFGKTRPFMTRVKSGIGEFRLSHNRHMEGDECTFEFELAMARVDDTVMDVIYNSSPVPLEDGKVGSLIMIKDITTRKQIEKRHMESERRYRQIFEHTFNGVLIAQDFRVVAINPSFCDMMGEVKEAILGTHIMRFVDDSNTDYIRTIHERRMAGDTEIFRFVITINTVSGPQIFSATSAHIMWEGKPASLFTIVPLIK